MGDKVKTSVVIDRRIWEEFKTRIAREKGLRMLSKAVEEAIEEEISDLMVIRVLEELLGSNKVSLIITPVKPGIPTDSGKVVGEIRGSRYWI